jgi:methylenetetrahydrofolate--tRNA-(uracil-5-)-methyltransferase
MLVRDEATAIPESSERAPVIVATGPLTSDSLSAEIARLVGAAHLYFYDAISPIVLAETIDMSKVFRQSRWSRSLRGRRPELQLGHAPALRDQTPDLPVFALRASDGSAEARSESSSEGGKVGPTCSADDGDGDYLNCPLTREEYERFYEALVNAESATVHDFDKERFFEGCLPIEVMAHRGLDTLRFGPMKPVGLTDPHTGREPYAVVQLRQDNLAGDHYSLVGFQTQVKWGDQARLLRLIPGLEQAEFVRLGMVHRNTYVNGPTVLECTWQVRVRPTLFFAGQMSGVEGYVESAASGLLAGINAAALATGAPLSTPPRTTAIGALAYYVSHADPAHYEPSNITFGIMEPPPGGAKGRTARKAATAERALADLSAWLEALDFARARAVLSECPARD